MASASSLLAANRPSGYHSVADPKIDGGKVAEEDPAQAEAAKSWTGRFASDVWEEAEFAWDGARELCIDFIMHARPWFSLCIDREVPRARLAHHWFLHYNPIWWLCIASMAVLLVPGHWTHKLVGQGGQVRSDELWIETRARVGWVYTYSGGFVCTIVWDLTGLLYCLVEAPRDPTVKSTSMSLLISAWYIYGNCQLLSRMRKRDTDMMHAMVINRINFGVAMLSVFLAGWVFSIGRHAYNVDFPRWTEATWICRLAFCLFMVVAYIGYGPLLSLCYDDPIFSVPDGALEMPAVAKGTPYWTTGRLLTLGFLGPIVLLACSLPFLVYGPSPLCAFIFVPVVTVVVALIMEGCGGLTKRMLHLVFTALCPCIVTFIGFMIAGADLWEWLAGK